jgi:hypothetical protein
MLNAHFDTPRSTRRPDLPIVFPFVDTIYFPDGCDGYGFDFNPNAAIEGGRFARRSRCDGCL